MPGTIHIDLLQPQAPTHLGAFPVPSSAVRVFGVPPPAFSPRGSAVSVAGAEAAVPTLSPPEARFAARDRSAEGALAVKRVGSGSARDDWVPYD